MGLNIGQVPASLEGPRLRGDFFAVRTRERDAGLGLRPLGATESGGGRGPFFQTEPSRATRLGFGAGTVSLPGAALETISRGVRNARQMIPTVQELQQEHRERLSELREDAARRTRERHERRIEVRLPEPSSQARNFINQLNETASIAEARLRGQEVPAGPGQASFEVNGETFTFAAPDGGTLNPSLPGRNEGFRIDIFV